MATRIAVSITAICIGIMLLSACGFAPINSKPYVQYNDFVLWLQAPGSPPQLAGFGRIGGPSYTQVGSTLTLLEPACLNRQILYLTGSLHNTPAPSLDLHAKLATGQQIQMHAVRPPPANEYSSNAIPAAGTLTLQGGCASGSTFNIFARFPPELHGQWLGSALPRPDSPLTIDEAMSQSSFDDRGDTHVSAAITIFGQPCFTRGQASEKAAVPFNSRSFTLNFKMDDGSTLTAATTLPPPQLDAPISAIEVHYNISGGPCDGQAFTATLHHR